MDADVSADTATPVSEAPAGSGGRFHGYLSMQARGVVALPPALRRRYALDRPGAQVEVTEREDGVLEVRPMVAVPASEAWFWTERWYTGERQVDHHVARGEVVTSDSTEDLLADLIALDEQAGAVEPSSPASSAATPAAELDVDPTAGPVGNAGAARE